MCIHDRYRYQRVICFSNMWLDWFTSPVNATACKVIQKIPLNFRTKLAKHLILGALGGVTQWRWKTVPNIVKSQSILEPSKVDGGLISQGFTLLRSLFEPTVTKSDNKTGWHTSRSKTFRSLLPMWLISDRCNLVNSIQQMLPDNYVIRRPAFFHRMHNSDAIGQKSRPRPQSKQTYDRHTTYGRGGHDSYFSSRKAFFVRQKAIMAEADVC